MRTTLITCLTSIFCICVSFAQEEINSRAEAYKELQVANKALKKAYDEARKELVDAWTEDGSPVKDFTAAHQAWLKWSKLEARVLAYDISGGGNTHGETVNLELTEMILQRIKFLNGAAPEEKVAAQPRAQIETPKRGSKLRSDICNAFRVPMAKEVGGQKIVFVISALNVMGDYAFINSSLQLANGKQVDWKKTKHRDYIEEGIENNAVGLLRKDSQGNWIVLETSFNATDAWWMGWSKHYGIDESIMRPQGK